jgi:ATP-binding cassette subfamily B protein
MVTDYYGKHFDLGFLTEKCLLTKKGTSMLKLSRAVKVIGFEGKGVKVTTEKLKEIVQDIPVILHWNRNHFVVVYKAPKPKKNGTFYIADPALGFVKYKSELEKAMKKKLWYCLLIEPTS